MRTNAFARAPGDDSAHQLSLVAVDTLLTLLREMKITSPVREDFTVLDIYGTSLRALRSTIESHRETLAREATDNPIFRHPSTWRPTR